MFPGWGEFGWTSWLYRRDSQDRREEVTQEDSQEKREEVTQEDLQERLDRRDLTEQELRDVVLLEEQLFQCRQFRAVFPNLSTSCAESRFDKYKTRSDRVLETWLKIKDRDREALEKISKCCRHL